MPNRRSAAQSTPLNHHQVLFVRRRRFLGRARSVIVEPFRKNVRRGDTQIDQRFLDSIPPITVAKSIDAIPLFLQKVGAM